MDHTSPFYSRTHFAILPWNPRFWSGSHFTILQCHKVGTLPWPLYLTADLEFVASLASGPPAAPQVPESVFISNTPRGQLILEWQLVIIPSIAHLKLSKVTSIMIFWEETINPCECTENFPIRGWKNGACLSLEAQICTFPYHSLTKERSPPPSRLNFWFNLLQTNGLSTWVEGVGRNKGNTAQLYFPYSFLL